MSKRQYYRSNVDVSLSQKKKEIHPVWRGIGLVMVVVIPVMSYLIALALVNANSVSHWVIYPAAIIFYKLWDPLIVVKVFVTIVIIFILYAIFTFITALFYKVFGTPRYGSTDVPPEQIRPVKRG
jgi:hypothetical protein